MCVCIYMYMWVRKVYTGTFCGGTQIVATVLNIHCIIIVYNRLRVFVPFMHLRIKHTYVYTCRIPVTKYNIIHLDFVRYYNNFGVYYCRTNAEVLQFLFSILNNCVYPYTYAEKYEIHTIQLIFYVIVISSLTYFRMDIMLYESQVHSAPHCTMILLLLLYYIRHIAVNWNPQ